MLTVQNRSWAVHSDQVSPLPYPPSQGVSPEDAFPPADTTMTMKAKDDKLPHDASVFVGSLPSNIDQGDLTRMLMEHLSEHTQIKNIKVVRDSKGGVCAFVQCENASSATALIQTLHSSAPKPFLGRILRYEPARAFRTLLISYRTPTHLARSVGPNESNLVSFASQEVELEVPNSMRIWKHRNSRFHSILYNSEASQAEQHHETVDSDGLESTIFLDSMKYDGETLHKLASYFGPLETFCVLPVESCDDAAEDVEKADPDYALYPAPHNARRSPGMATACWEVKWEHRDDCFNYSGARHWAPEAGTPFSKFSGSLSHTEEGIAAATISQKPWSSEDQETQDEDQYARDFDSSDTVDVGAQELYIPQTPALDTSSITPLTPGSQFPLTPTTSGFDTSQELTTKSFGEDDHNVTEPRDPRSQREIDPTTLFVGGLEMFGPGAWDEEKVRKFFSRFGGLESVKVVRPLNACAAFAFVKFDNAESPARAVYEEVIYLTIDATTSLLIPQQHNRVYEGRAMRVQLRDCNPPKNIWKYGRPRGKFHQNHHGPQRRFNFRPPYDGQERGLFRLPTAGLGGNATMANSSDASNIQLSSLASALPSYEGSERNASPRGSETVIAHSSASDATKSSSNDPEAEQYREWYDEPVSPVHTPAPSTLGSSVSAAGVQFPAQTYPYLPNGPYFPPPPWMHPYMHQAPYQVPYYTGYPMYSPSVPPPQQITQPSSPPSSDTGGPATVAPHVWPAMGMYGSYVPYAVVSPRPQMAEQGLVPPMATQAPLMPTGFIQNEQGTLIPVYQPEALDQYMAGSGGTPASLPNTRDANTQRWVPFNGRPYDLGSIQPSTPHTIPNPDRPKNIETSSAPPQRFPESQKSPVPFRGPDGNLNTLPSPLYRRQGARRECQPNYNAVRNNNNHPWTFNSRPRRPFVQQFGAPQTSDQRGEAQSGNHWER
ncbi:hypothetical protein NLJ89_g4071 [Agrocybe chaxingu]|uniref:RRM domain-containing protein n=1 Tax=Agrocybe chaxingu TaxID=84603 RepID=A0A9W8MWV5_9AGAR|nr:hypothetical protein NLJ89_g4071 [Agrocybe chaxingu]